MIHIISLFVISIILFGCGKTQFTKETHKRELEFTRQFEMLTCEKPYGKLCVETEDEEEARKVEAFVDAEALFPCADFFCESKLFFFKAC